MRRFLLVLILGLMVACTPQAVQDTPESIPTAVPTEEPTSIPTNTDTPIPPTETPVPPTDTPTEVPTATVTPSPTSAAVFEELRILGGHFNTAENSIIYLAFPKVDKDFKYVMDNHDYECELAADYPDRVTCFGRFLDNEQAESVLVQVFDPITEIKLFEDYIYVPMTLPPPVPCSPIGDECPVRGINMFCETEWRQESDGVCTVQTCYDSCGYCYSVHTCKEDVTERNAILNPTLYP